jgi:hypothetical protein
MTDFPQSVWPWSPLCWLLRLEERNRTEIVRMSDRPSGLELALLGGLAKQLPQSDKRALEEQLKTARVVRRENTGSGFFTHLVLEDRQMDPIKSDVKSYCVSSKIGDIDDAIGFILWLDQGGYMKMFEGYSQALVNSDGLDWTNVPFEITYPTPADR